jgi:hypothetical protein
VRWHPRSRLHFATLTSDNVFSVFDISSPAEAEQAVRLPMRRGGGVDIGFGAPGSHTSLRAVDFAFGPGAGWDVLSVYFMTRCAPFRFKRM